MIRKVEDIYCRSGLLSKVNSILYICDNMSYKKIDYFYLIVLNTAQQVISRIYLILLNSDAVDFSVI